MICFLLILTIDQFKKQWEPAECISYQEYEQPTKAGADWNGVKAIYMQLTLSERVKTEWHDFFHNLEDVWGSTTADFFVP